MPVKVVDASALGALIFGEPERVSVANRLDGADLVAPTLLDFEIANIYLTKLRRRPSTRAELLAALAMFGRMRIARVPVDRSGLIGLAEQFGLTAYDASYLWLAGQRSAELVTLDKRLQAALDGRA